MKIIKLIERLEIFEIYFESTITKKDFNERNSNYVDVSGFKLNKKIWVAIRNKFTKIDEVRIKIMVRLI